MSSPAEWVLDYCLGLPGAWEDHPWEDHTVAKVGEKIFAFVGEEAVGLKCGADRFEADEWLAEYPEDATVMSYIGRNGWNDLRVGRGIPGDEVLAAIDDSYVAVVSKIPKSRRPDGWDEVGA